MRTMRPKAKFVWLRSFALLGVLAAWHGTAARAQEQSPMADKATSATQANTAAGASTEAGATSTSSTLEKLRIKFSGQIEGGGTYNPAHPKNGINFGRLFDDKANTFLLNQTLVTLERPLDPLAKSFDWGFKLQVMLGSDARYTQYLGEFGGLSDNRVQPEILEAYINTHFPILTPGGVDVKAGQFVTLEGAEVINASGNFFYSHSYIFNFGIPLDHLGVMATTHVNKYIDLYTGLTRGVNVGTEDNNSSWAFHGGVGLNLLDGKATVLATTHIGPENVNDNDNNRLLNDITMILKLSEKLTATTDLNFARDNAADADAYGIAQYFTYTINDWLAAGVRGEVFRDSDGFFVAAFPDSSGFTDFEQGKPAEVIGGGDTTYGALTLGLNIKPPFIKNLLLRPELRFDRALNGGSHPFNDSDDRNMVTAAMDFIYSF